MIKELYRRFIAFLKRLFGRRPSKLGLTESELASKLQGPERKSRVARIVQTSRGGINMPKLQPCPRCYAQSPRWDKMPIGARYKCRSHGLFFVAASKKIRGYA